MIHSDIEDPLFRQAVEYVYAGNIDAIKQVIEGNPSLVAKRLDFPENGYFRHPYLLWFVAGNPARNSNLPGNIADVTRLIIESIRDHVIESLQLQLNYTLGLVVTSRIALESGVQIELTDLLIDAGANPGNGLGALAQGNTAVAAHLMERGAILTLAAAICLNRTDDITRLLEQATAADMQLALMAAAFYGKADMITLLIQSGVDVNAYIDSSTGFHSHASALHQAISSGSLESVKLLIKAGASLTATDKIYKATPLDWCAHMQATEKDPLKTQKYKDIGFFLPGMNRDV